MIKYANLIFTEKNGTVTRFQTSVHVQVEHTPNEWKVAAMKKATEMMQDGWLGSPERYIDLRVEEA